jgi:glutathione S-transferase
MSMSMSLRDCATACSTLTSSNSRGPIAWAMAAPSVASACADNRIRRQGLLARPGASPGRILWGVGTSRTIRAHWALHELGLDYQMRPIQPRTGETLSEEYSALTARQKVPLLQDRGLVITESAAIIAYLSDTYGQQHNRLMPTAPAQRAKYLEWCFFIISELDATSLYVMRRHMDLKAVYGEAPAANSAAAAYF